MKASDVKIGETYRVCVEDDPLFNQLVMIKGWAGGRFTVEVLDTAVRGTWSVHPDVLEPISSVGSIEAATIEEIMDFLGV